MTDREPIEISNLDGHFDSPPLVWDRARDLLASGPSGLDPAYFLSTSRPAGGAPHTAGIGALWLDGDLVFTSGPGTRKSRNLAASPACTVAVRLPGLDLVLEGDAVRVTDPAVLADAAARYREGGWPAEVAGDAFTAPYSAPSAGPAPWHLYRFTFHTAFGTATAAPLGATRWRFA